MIKSLHTRLAAVMLALFAAYGGLNMVLSLVTARAFLDEVVQGVNLNLADQVASSRALIVNGRVNRPVATQLFDTIISVNPLTEVYLLDPAGRVLAFSGAAEQVVRDRVAVEPLQRLLAGNAPPVLGDDPRHADGHKIFSVTRLPAGSAGSRRLPERAEGYLYIVLGGEHFDSIVKMLISSQMLRWGLWTAAASLLFATLAAIALFGRLTRRLRVLASDMDAFRHSDFAEAHAWQFTPRPVGDDIDKFGAIFVRMRERLAEQVDRVRQIDEQRRQLVANVSHDLRTPLASLQGYLETLATTATDLTDEERGYLEIAVRQSEHVSQLVDQLFELAQLDDARSTQLRLESFSMCELAQDAVDKRQLVCQQQSLTLVAELERTVPPVNADIALIERVLDNLIENALRYTPVSGRVVVICRADPPGVRISVSDTGPGIAVTDLPRIFDRSYRGAQPPTRGSPGSGLGLAIAKRILELHGSTLTVTSVPGEGAMFTFTLPV